MKNWGRYELLSAPAEADLVLEASLVPEQAGFPRLRLAILDPKTHVVLWAFAKRVNTRGFHAYWDYDEAISKIVDDFKNLNARAKAADESAQK